jgi:hypothetical protein
MINITYFKENIHIYFAWFLRLTLVIAMVFEILNERWTLLFATTLILLSTFIPTIIEKRYQIMIPDELEVLIIIFIYASLFLGELRDYYVLYWWWDILLHTSSGIGLGFVGFIIMYSLYRKKVIASKPIWIAIFSFCFALALGTLWEIFEFSMDQIFKTSMQKSGIIDTMWDLIVDALGALFIAIIGYFYCNPSLTVC